MQKSKNFIFKNFLYFNLIFLFFFKSQFSHMMALESNTCFYSALNVYLHGCGVQEPYALFHKEFVEEQLQIDKRIPVSLIIKFKIFFFFLFYFFFVFLAAVRR